MSDLENRKEELEEAAKVEHEKNCASFAKAYEALCKKHNLQYVPGMLLEGGHAPQVLMRIVAIS